MTSLTRLSFAGLLALALTTSAGAADQRRRAASRAPQQPDLHAAIMDANGRQVGIAEVGRTGEGLIVAVDVNGLPAGRYAVHLHGVGRCDAPRFESAGGHWNPTNMHHGAESREGGPHMGDLPNLAVNANGRGFYQFLITDGYTTGRRNAIMDADGAAIVIHAGEDDYRTDPSGNSGNRIACGVMRRSG